MSKKLILAGTTLANVLAREIKDTPATRFYQGIIDQGIERLKGEWDLTNGFPVKGKAAKGRVRSAPLGFAAFCWYSPLSKYHHDPELLTFFLAGLKDMVASINVAGEMTERGMNGESWAHGWDIEGLIYGLHFCKDRIDDELSEFIAERFAFAAERLADLPKIPGIIGSYGNQRVVWTLGLYLYGTVLANQRVLDVGERYFEDAMVNTLDASGQVIEQQGPCLHYSYTAFVYAWINLALRDDHSEDARIEKCLKWFRNRHTISMYNLPGPTSRKYNEHLSGHLVDDLIGAAEYIAPRNAMPREWVLRTTEPEAVHKSKLPPPRFGVSHHVASPLMWAILFRECEEPASPAERVEWSKLEVIDYSTTNLLKRFPMKHVHVRQQYQTEFTHRDYMPFAGLQTWAWQDEPPIIHPTPLAPSTTRAYSLDTARQGTSHNWGGFGAGALGISGYLRPPKRDDEIYLLVAMYDWFWRFVLFTECSTVIYEFGNGGERTTYWTLNRLEPAEPDIREGIVTFAGRGARLYTTVKAKPELISLNIEHEWADGVRQLKYVCGSDTVGFAFSGGGFSFDDEFDFTDESGSYKVTPAPDWFTKANPGNLEIDVFQLAHGSVAKRK